MTKEIIKSLCEEPKKAVLNSNNKEATAKTKATDRATPIRASNVPPSLLSQGISTTTSSLPLQASARATPTKANR